MFINKYFNVLAKSLEEPTDKIVNFFKSVLNLRPNINVNFDATGNPSFSLALNNEDRTKAKIIFAGIDDPLEEWVEVQKLEDEYLGYAFMLKKVYEYEHDNGKKTLAIDNQKHWFWSTLGVSKKI